MKTRGIIICMMLVLCLILSNSCSVLEKSSQHGFENGYYKYKLSDMLTGKAYLNIEDQKVEVYKKNNNGLENLPLTISLLNTDSLSRSYEFTKRSLDIDLTTILLKYRPSVYGLPAQMITDFNVALYAGWRHDKYLIRNNTGPLKKSNYYITNRGYDFGIFAGPGTTFISPFSTRNHVDNEYNGTILQYGVAGFIESNVASFGIAAGFDYLLSPDRKIWIYNKKPWLGLIIGIAMN